MTKTSNDLAGPATPAALATPARRHRGWVPVALVKKVGRWVFAGSARRTTAATAPRAAAPPVDPAAAASPVETRPVPAPPPKPVALPSSVETRAAWIVPVRQPMILISQIQRSGGTLVCRLFDDHPECFAHPYELLWGQPEKSDWPELDPAATPAALFEALDESWVRRAVSRGYYAKWREKHPFLFDRALQRRIFESRLGPAPAHQRAVLDAYLTSLFNAWLDYQSIYRDPKRFVVGFRPRVNMRPASLERFWTDYPDGYLISVIREPAGWFASAQRHGTQRNPDEFAVMENAIGLWRESGEGTLAAHAARPDQVIVVLFEDLIQNTEAVMRRVCERTRLTFRESLLHPTYNGRPVESNSHFDPYTGIDRLTLDRGTVLSPEHRSSIAATAGDLYGRAKDQFGL